MAIGRTNTGGGGSVLNIEVVPGTTKPTNPKENTIWANSSYTMGSWAISPTEPHRVSRSTNLIVYPYLYDTRTNSGVTMTVDDTSGNKGVITLNGTNTSSASIILRLSNNGVENREMLLQPGTYHLCGNCESSSASTHRLCLAFSYDNWDNTNAVYDNGSGQTFKITNVAKARVGIQVQGGVTVTSVAYKPQLEKGSSATDYVMGNATGQIWVKTDAKSTVLMDAVKGKNDIVVHPRSVYEYTTNNGWVERSAEIYQYGAWTAFDPAWDGYFYKAGDECEDITGGWTAEGWTSNAWSVLQLSAVNSDNLYVVGQNQCMSAVGTVQKVDLSGTQTLKASINQTAGTVTLCISDSQNHSESVAVIQNTTTGTCEVSLDVSGYNGSYYIIVFAHGAGSEATIMNVWSEKNESVLS